MTPAAALDHRPPPNDAREVFGWVAYDWANSAFITTVGTVLLGPLGAVTAKSFYPYCVSLSVFLQIFLLPVLGAIADYTHYKKRLMAVFCYLGAAATCLLFFVTRETFLLGGL